MSHIFISYSRSDIEQAQRVVNALAASKMDTWIDWKSIPKGEDWEQEIYRGIEAADAFLFLISNDSVASEMCNKEIAHALKNGKRILPIFIADVPDRELYNVSAKFLREENRTENSRRNFIKCRAGRDDIDSALGEIRTTIQNDYEWLKYHTRLQVKVTLEWGRRRDESRLLSGKELQEAEQQLASGGTRKDPQPTPSQRQYVLASRTDADRRRRRTTTALTIGIAALAVLCLAAVVASVVAVGQRNLALTREQEALDAQARAEEERRIAL